MPNAKIVVAGTGGTIAGRSSVVGDNVGYRAGEVPIAELMEGLAARVTALGGIQMELVQVAQVDSKDMGPAVWGPMLRNLQRWLDAPEVKAVVVTHGTDTLEETAYLLARVLQPQKKPVVLTCAMRPASALVPDGPQNLLDALSVALDERTAGVQVVAAGWVHAARHISKIHTYRLDAFSSGDAGPIGCVEEGRLRWFGKASVDAEPAGAGHALGRIDFAAFSEASWPRVEVITSHSGATGDAVDAMLLQANGPRPLRGLVVAGTGNGTLHHELEAALLRAQAAGVVVWRTTRCAFGQVVGCADVPATGPDAASTDFMPSAAGSSASLPASALPPVKARIELMLHLMARDSMTR